MARGRKRKKDQTLNRGHEQNARRAARWNRLREIAGLGFVAITIAAIIALASYSARDPSFNVVTGSGAVHNFLGVFGAYFADLLIQFFGFGAWLFPVHAFGAAVLCFTHIPISFARRIGRLFGLTIFSLSLVALGHLAFGGGDPLYNGGGQPVPGGGVVGKLLLTGDNRFVNYNEPEAMRRTAMKLGVPDGDVVLDYAGRRTYDSCYRAREIFGVKRAILVTQAFHLERALYLCDAFGLDSLGVAADRRQYTQTSQTWWSIREAAATLAAWLDVNVRRPTPVLGPPLPIGN